MIRSIDLSKKPKTLRLSLHKPNREKIANLKDISNPSFTFTLGDALSSLTFSIPYFVDRRHELVENSNIDKIYERFLIKLKWNNVTQWYIITEVNDDSESEHKTISAKALANELTDKMIRGLSETSVSPKFILDKALNDTIWSTGDIYSAITSKARSFEVSETTVLDFVSEIADKFGVFPEFDSENRKVHLKHPDEFGFDRGMKFSYGKYLKSLSRTSNAEEMVTRLKVYGKDELSIQTANPTGANYIESFNYFLYPFERDANKNTISNSTYLTEGLCHAILDYEELVKSKQGEFDTLLTNLKTINTNLSSRNGELFILETELTTILDELDVAKANGNDTSTIKTRRNTKQAEIDAKNAEINIIKADKATVETSISNLKSTLSIENNFTPDQIIERNQYIIERTWSDVSYTNAEELFTEAKLKFEDVRKPKVTFTVDIVNFLEMISEQRNWDRLYLGDYVYIYHEKLKVYIKAMITEISYDDGEINLTVSDIIELKRNDHFMEMLKKSHSSSTSVDMSKYKWNKSVSDVGEINEIINAELDASKRKITAGVSNSVDISGRGIIIRNPDFPNEIIIIQSGIIALSEDNGENWQTAITPQGVVAERLMGRVIAGVNLVIENESGKFRFDANGATIEGASFNIVEGLNGISLDPTVGLIIKSAKNTITFNADKGMEIKRNSDGKIMFSVDSATGNVTFGGVLNGATGTFSGELQAATGSFSGQINGGSMVISSSNLFSYSSPLHHDLFKAKLVNNKYYSTKSYLADTSTILTYEVDAKPGESFVLSFYHKRKDGTNATIRGSLRFATDTGTHIQTISSSDSSILESYKKIVVKGTTPVNATKLRLYFNITSGDATGVYINGIMWNRGNIELNYSPHTDDDITMGSITAERMNVAELSAISADLGYITAGTVQGNEFVIKRPDGFNLVTNGYANFDFTVDAADPPFISAFVEQFGRFYRTKTFDTHEICNLYSFRHTGRYLKLECSYFIDPDNAWGEFQVERQGGEVLLTHRFTNTSEPLSTQIFTIDLNVPDGLPRGVYVKLKSSSTIKYASWRKIRIWQEL